MSVGRVPDAAGCSAVPRLQARPSPPTARPLSPPPFPEVDRVFTDYAREVHVPGMAWGVIVDGRLVHTGTFGVQDTTRRRRSRPTSVFRIASMTKSFTAVAILSLRDAGKLSLDDPAETYVPELKGLAYPTTDSPRMTIRHLLSHAAGFPEDNPWGDQQLALSDDEMSALMRQGIPFSNPPGLAYEYSNYGFAILGRIVTKVSGMPTAITCAAGCSSRSVCGRPRSTRRRYRAARLVHGYRWEDERWKEEPPLPDGAFGAMGGMLTSLRDLSRYVAWMMDAWPARDGAETGPFVVRRAARCSRCGGPVRLWRGARQTGRCSSRPAATATACACRSPADSATSWRTRVACQDSDRRCGGCRNTASAWSPWDR